MTKPSDRDAPRGGAAGEAAGTSAARSGPSDSELVAATLAGSHDAYGDLVRRYERPVLGLILRMVRNRGEAEELAQDVFLKAFDRLASYDQGRKFSSWLFKVAHNATIDHLRRRRLVTVPLESPDDDEVQLADVLAESDSRGPEESAVRGELMRAIEAALGELRPAHREVLLLRFRHGCSYFYLTDTTTPQIDTLNTHLHRPSHRLAKSLEERGWSP